MAKYILVKKVKGKKYEYQVIDADSKAIVSKRTSARDYVACTADGSFYFGRLDLIGKGDHGKRLSHTAAILANPVIFEFGFFETISNSRFFIRFVFHKKPNQRLYCTLSVIKRLSRVIILPENVLFIIHPSRSTHLSEYSIQRNTVVTVSPGKYTILSRTFARNSLIVFICAVVTLCKSRFFVCNDLINAASSARYFLYSDNFNSKFPTFAAFKLSFV